MGLCFGGALYTDSGVNTVNNAQTSVVLSESEFSSNTAMNGAVLSTFNCTVSVYSSNIFNNVAEVSGGVVWIQTGSVLKVSESKIVNNHALTHSGGVVYAIDASTVTINETEIHHNSALRGGGVVHLDYLTSIGFFGCFMWNNSAQEVGGVFAVSESGKIPHNRVNVQKKQSFITIVDSYFESNFANFTGGIGSIVAIYATNLNLIRSKFVKKLSTLRCWWGL